MTPQDQIKFLPITAQPLTTPLPMLPNELEYYSTEIGMTMVFVEFEYLNHRKELARRKVQVKRIVHGRPNEFHPSNSSCWMLEGFDCNRREHRQFLIQDITKGSMTVSGMGFHGTQPYAEMVEAIAMIVRLVRADR